MPINLRTQVRKIYPNACVYHATECRPKIYAILTEPDPRFMIKNNRVYQPTPAFEDKIFEIAIRASTVPVRILSRWSATIDKAWESAWHRIQENLLTQLTK